MPHVLNLGEVATKIVVPSRRRVRKRGHAGVYAILHLIALALLSGIVFLASERTLEFGAQQLAIYMTGGIVAVYLASIFWIPTRMWHYRERRNALYQFCMGIVAMALMISVTMPQIDQPNWMWDVKVEMPISKMYSFQLPTDKELDLLTRVVYGEARGEGPQDQANIVHTILNRAEDSRLRYGKTISDILLTPKAFSCLNPDDENYRKLLNLKTSDLTYKKIYAIIVNTIVARMNGMNDPIAGATHYHTAAVDPHWNRNAKSMIKIGNHQFWTEVDN